MEHRFLVMWCNEGLECVVDLTNMDRMNIWNTLKDSDTTFDPHLRQMILRARFNSQRCYEIYAVSAVEGITKRDITEMFLNSPEYAAETIRRLGDKIYSDRTEKSKQVIT